MATMSGPNLKVKRAKEHLDSLDGAVKSLRKSKPYGISAKDDVEVGQWVVTIEVEKPLISLGLIAGDFISCLRSSLDYLAWQMCGLTNPNPPDCICFPICGVDSPGTQGYIVKSTDGVPEDAITIMKQFQPYASGDAYKSTHLWRLHKLWNIDKHRHIPFHSVAVEVYFPNLSPGIPVQSSVINDRYVVRFPLSAHQEMNLDPLVGMEIQFGDEVEGIILTIQDFFDIYEFVSQKVIPSFSSFFPRVAHTSRF